MNEEWNIQKRSSQCVTCQQAFANQQTLFCFLNLEDPEPIRKDYCQNCWEQVKDQSEKIPFYSFWQTRFRQVKLIAKEDPVKKDQVEALLKKYLSSENSAHKNLCYILAVMLERKKILSHKDTTTEPDGKNLLVYEHNKTGETFLISDPHLKLTEIQGVQQQVKALLDAELNPPVAVPATD